MQAGLEIPYLWNTATFVSRKLHNPLENFIYTTNMTVRIMIANRFLRSPICTKMKSWAFRTCEHASIHGLIWYTRVENRLISLIIILLCLMIIFITPGYVILRCLEFGRSEKILTTTSSLRLKVATYPTITVCHGKYFTNERLARKYLKLLLSKKFLQN